MNVIDVLSRWNRWGTATLSPGLPRAAMSMLRPFLDTRDVVALVGPRRAGKSTLMFQAMDALEARGVPRDAVLHVNLEEPALQPALGTDLLDELYRTHREQVFPRGRAYVFLDEVQRVPGWERWTRARTETDDLKVFVTGSTSRLLSRELGTLLTGRHVELRVWPLGFGEFLDFRGIPRPRMRLSAAGPLVANALLEYLRWGGFPEIVLATDVSRREVLLRQYFDDILFKDVAMRHEVRDVVTLRSLAVHLLTSTASLVSYQRLRSLLGISLDQARAYCSHLEEAFMVTFVPAFSLKVAERHRNPQKVHAVDTGLRNIVAISGSADTGRLAETAAFAAMRRVATEPLHYWRGDGEVDALARRGAETTRLVQVAWEVPADALSRELGGLEAASAEHPRARRQLVLGRVPRAPKVAPGVEVVPLWRFLLEDQPAPVPPGAGTARRRRAPKRT